MFFRRVIGNHRFLPATVVTALLTLGALTGTAIALSAQHHAPQPPLTVGPTAPMTSPPSKTHAPAPAVVGPVMPASLPVSISIPAIRVESTLLRLGRTAGGALAVPPPGPTYDSAGWYVNSPAPGSLGPAVIAGHVDSAANGPSVFFRLGGLKAGDLVQVTRVDHSVATFRVDAVRRYHKTEFPTELVYGNTDHAALRLITCGGSFDTSTGHYGDNIVVLASLIASAA